MYDGEKPVFMKPLSPMDEMGDYKTLGHFLNEVDETLIERNNNEQISLNKNIKIVVQGVEPSLDTPVIWLVDFCSNPDNFLHIVVVRRELIPYRSGLRWTDMASKVFGMGKSDLSSSDFK